MTLGTGRQLRPAGRPPDDLIGPDLLGILPVIDQPVMRRSLRPQARAGLADVVAIQKAEPGKLLDRGIVDIRLGGAVIGTAIACQKNDENEAGQEAGTDGQGAYTDEKPDSFETLPVLNPVRAIDKVNHFA